MEQKIWVIYKHTLVLDCPHKGWSYIGQTRMPTKIRWKSGYGYTSKCQIFRSAIDKYGWDSFSHEILEDGILTLEEANEREKYWIAHYHTFIRDPECRGYNMTPGGGASDMVKQTIEKDGVYQKVFVAELPRFELDGWRVVPVKEVQKLWYKATKEKRKEHEREYRAKYRAEHLEELQAKNRQYAKDNREKVKAKQREWMAENVDHIKVQKAPRPAVFMRMGIKRAICTAMPCCRNASAAPDIMPSANFPAKPPLNAIWMIWGWIWTLLSGQMFYRKSFRSATARNRSTRRICPLLLQTS